MATGRDGTRMVSVVVRRMENSIRTAVCSGEGQTLTNLDKTETPPERGSVAARLPDVSGLGPAAESAKAEKAQTNEAKGARDGRLDQEILLVAIATLGIVLQNDQVLSRIGEAAKACQPRVRKREDCARVGRLEVPGAQVVVAIEREFPDRYLERGGRDAINYVVPVCGPQLGNARCVAHYR